MPAEEKSYESPDIGRPATATPTEAQLEREIPGGSRAAGADHDPYIALRFSECRNFIIGWTIAELGGQLQFTAVGWDLYHRTGTAMSLGWAGLAMAAPVILLSVPAGQLADQIDRRKIVIGTQLAATVFSIALAFISHSHATVGWIYVLLFAIATCQAIGWPARGALLPATVPLEHFSNAATWNSSAFQLASVLGPAMGGLILRWSTPATYAAAAVCGLIFALILMPMKLKPAARDKEPTSLKTVLAGIKFVRAQPLILATITMDLFAVLLGGATYLLPIYASDILKVGSVGFGWLRAAPALGAVTMALIMAHRPPMKYAGRNLLLAVAGFGIATIIFGLSKSFWLSLAMLALTGVFDNISVIVRHTLVQLLTPDAMRGRVSAVNNIFIGASNELGGWESGMTASLLGPIWSVVGGGIGTLLVVFGVAMIWPQVRRIGRLDETRIELNSEHRDA